MIPSFSPSAPLTASPAASGNGTTLAAPIGTRAWVITVSVQAAYITLDGSAPTSTNGLTIPAGSVFTLHVPASLTVLAATAGAIVNAIPLK